MSVLFVLFFFSLQVCYVRFVALHCLPSILLESFLSFFSIFFSRFPRLMCVLMSMCVIFGYTIRQVIYHLSGLYIAVAAAVVFPSSAVPHSIHTYIFNSIWDVVCVHCTHSTQTIDFFIRMVLAFMDFCIDKFDLVFLDGFSGSIFPSVMCFTSLRLKDIVQ